MVSLTFSKRLLSWFIVLTAYRTDADPSTTSVQIFQYPKIASRFSRSRSISLWISVISELVSPEWVKPTEISRTPSPSWYSPTEISTLTPAISRTIHAFTPNRINLPSRIVVVIMGRLYNGVADPSTTSAQIFFRPGQRSHCREQVSCQPPQFSKIFWLACFALRWGEVFLNL